MSTEILLAWSKHAYRHPVLLGSGIPLFHEMGRQIDLELLDCKVLRNGCVFVLYRVKR